MKIPVLLYHGMNVHGNAYETNDHVALAADVAQIARMGFEAMPLHRIVHAWRSDRASLEGRRIVALTCDDGSDFDARDLDHPKWGVQRSFLDILRDFAKRLRRGHVAPHMTSFVIVSPEARAKLDRTCMVGKGWWNEDWWASAAATGLMAIANHSWDHNHESIADERWPEVRRGTFTTIDSEALADYQIAQADDYLRARLPSRSAGLFAYPYGEANAFLAGQWFPRHSDRFTAAFTTEPAYLTEASDPWRMPRFTCGRDWKTPAEFRAILEGALAP